MMLGLMFIALASACIWTFSLRAGQGGLLLSTVMVTSPPAPGVFLTDWKRCWRGYLVQPGLTRPSGLPGRSGAGPATGTKVGNFPSATFDWAEMTPVPVVGAAACVGRAAPPVVGAAV